MQRIGRGWVALLEVNGVGCKEFDGIFDDGYG